MLEAQWSHGDSILKDALRNVQTSAGTGGKALDLSCPNCLGHKWLGFGASGNRTDCIIFRHAVAI